MPKVRTRKKGNGRNIELYYVDGLTGRERTKSSGTRIQREADKAAARWESQIDRETFSETKAWKPAAELFLSYVKARVSDSTYDGYSRAIVLFEELIGAPRELASVTTLVLDRFVASIRKAYPHYKVGTISLRLGGVRTFLRWCASRDIIAKVPLVPMPKLPPAEELGGDPITEEQFNKLMELLPNRDHALARGMWLSGLRPGEAVRLHWTNDPVRLVLDGPRSYIHFEPDGQKSRRREDMPLTADFVAFLESLPNRTGYVLNPFKRTSSTLRKDFQEAMESLDFSVTPKIMRKSFATRWVMLLNHVELQSLMRHKSITTTLKHYAKVTRDQIQQGVWAKSFAPPDAPKGDIATKPRENSNGKKAVKTRHSRILA